MTNESHSPDDPRLNRLIATYLEAIEAGESPERESLVLENPDLADELKSFFANQDQMKAAVRDLDSPTIVPLGVEADAGLEEPTLLPSDTSKAEEATLQQSGLEKPAPLGTTVRYFGDYELLEEIARGGMGVVYKARQTSLNRVVALKMILAGQLASEEDVLRFYSEAEAAANLDHPGIVPIFEVGEHDGHHYFSMGLVEGSSLAKQIADGPLLPKVAAQLVVQIAGAVQYAHDKGVIHRDLKPANILLDEDSQPRITDFGLAKKVEGDSGLTATGQILGTPSYMPPEQASGKLDEVTETADVYALGTILYSLVTGRPPFQAASPLDTLMQVLEKEPVSPRLLNPNVPRDLDTICMKCLHKETRGRYLTASALAQDLDRHLNNEPIEARPVGVWERAIKWAKRRPAAAALLAVSFVAVVGLLVTTVVSLYFFGQSRFNERGAWNWYMRSCEALIVQGQSSYANSYLDDVPQEFRNARWTVLKRECQRNIQTLRPRVVISAVAVSPDGRHFAHANYADVGGVKVRNVETGSTVFSRDGACNSAVFSPDGRWLVGTGRDHSVKVWDLSASSAAQQDPRVFRGHTDDVFTLAFSHDGRRLASAGKDSTVRIWDFSTGEEVFCLKQHQSDVRCVVFGPKGRWLATAAWDHTARLWDLSNGQQLQVLEHRGYVYCVAFTPDGRWLTSGGSDGIVRFWRPQTGTVDRSIPAHLGGVRDLKFTSDGSRLVTAGDDARIRVWAVKDQKLSLVLTGHTGPITTLAIHPDDSRVFSATTVVDRGDKTGGDMTIRVWDISER